MIVLIQPNGMLDAGLISRLEAVLTESGHECRVMNDDDIKAQGAVLVLPDIFCEQYSACLTPLVNAVIERQCTNIHTANACVKTLLFAVIQNNSPMQDARVRQRMFRPPTGSRIRI
jgi:hypothetical protein